MKPKKLKTNKTWHGRNSLTGEVAQSQVVEQFGHTELHTDEDTGVTCYIVYNLNGKEIAQWNTKKV